MQNLPRHQDIGSSGSAFSRRLLPVLPESVLGVDLTITILQSNMARIVQEYREKRIIVITSPRSATAQFEHNGRVYQSKLTNLPVGRSERDVIHTLFKEASAQVDRVLGPLKAQHLVNQEAPPR